MIMTKEEAIYFANCLKNNYTINFNDMEAFCDTVIQALDQESETVTKFTEWVVSEIFDENWEYNKDSFAELACRKLEKLGIVRVKGDEWELVELQAEKEEV